jgi:hypothetical protein
MLLSVRLPPNARLRCPADARERFSIVHKALDDLAKSGRRSATTRQQTPSSPATSACRRFWPRDGLSEIRAHTPRGTQQLRHNQSTENDEHQQISIAFECEPQLQRALNACRSQYEAWALKLTIIKALCRERAIVNARCMRATLFSGAAVHRQARKEPQASSVSVRPLTGKDAVPDGS